MTKAPNGSAISIRNASKRFLHNGNSTIAIDNVSVEVQDGEFCVIIGPSGCGKSTLLNLISGLDTPDGGSVHFYGSEVKGTNKAVGYLTQDDTLLPWADAWSNIALPLTLRARRVTGAKLRSRVDAHLSLVGLEGFSHHYPHQLSGGMRRRVALARTLVYDPRVLLMDEPFGALDAQLKRTLQGELLRIWSEQSKTVIFVTHDLDEAIVLADRIVVMSSRPGRVLAQLEVKIPRPRDVHHARFHPEFQLIYERLLEYLYGIAEPASRLSHD